MKKIYHSTLALFATLFLISCESDNTEVLSQESRISPLSSRQLRIVNNSDLQLVGEVYCFGAQNNIAVNPAISIKGRIALPANTDITYRNFVQTTNPNYAINQWFVSVNSAPVVAYNPTATDHYFGQYYSPGASSTKFANWRYLKVKLAAPSIPGFEPVPMIIELPSFSANNAEERVVDLMPYGMPKFLHITQSSTINQTGSTILTIDSQIVDQN